MHARPHSVVWCAIVATEPLKTAAAASNSTSLKMIQKNPVGAQSMSDEYISRQISLECNRPDMCVARRVRLRFLN